ncbi:MAG: potassium channel family protein [Candidatus Magasanikbacteria bacterium]|nr:potassium channel family protein [Candidatus Magasanikbacteria bacterium]
MQRKIVAEQSNHHGAQKAAAVSALLLLIFLGTMAYHWLETWSWTQSFYFTVSTLATVGYGDLHPTSDGSRLFTAFFILAGVSIAVAALSVIGSSYIDNRTRYIMKENRKRR